jgi:hypothetical protein
MGNGTVPKAAFWRLKAAFRAAGRCGAVFARARGKAGSAAHFLLRRI